MKMKIHPRLFSELPRELFKGEEEKTVPKALRKLCEKKLETLIELSFTKTKDKESLIYANACTFLKVDPLIPLKSNKETTTETKAGAIQKAMANRRTYNDPKWGAAHGYAPEDMAYFKKRELERLKLALKKTEDEGLCLNWAKAHDNIQTRVWAAVAQYIYLQRKKKLDVDAFLTATEDALALVLEIKRFCGGREQIKEFKEVIARAGLYECPLSGKVHSEKADPKVNAHVFFSLTEFDTMAGVSTSVLGDRWQKFIPPVVPALIKDVTTCYIDTKGEFGKSDQVTFSVEKGAWVEDKSPNKWLCVGARVNTNLLNYSTQPMPQKESDIRKLGAGLQHRVGFEVEFQEPYRKEMCIKNREGRPLTPSKVLEDWGWALCPDSSVQGGELKSPVLFFKNEANVNQLLQQIPMEIREFINNVAKDGNCGGHLNYSHANWGPQNCMMAIATWGFLFPLFPECDQRLENKKLVNHHGHHFCEFKRIDDPAYKYQWIRLKRHCMEIRVFDAHWNVEALLWRAKLAALMIQDVEQKVAASRANGNPTCLDYPYWENSLIDPITRLNWKSFQNPEHPIREHLRTTINRRAIAEKIATPSYQKRIAKVLNFVPEPEGDLKLI